LSRFDRANFNINGGMIGGTPGAQIQQSYVVPGHEGDLDRTNIKGNATTIPTIAGIPSPITLAVATNTSTVSTFRARAGVALNNWLVYGSGDAAFLKSSASGSSIAGIPCGTLGIMPNCSGSAWRPGLAAGMGMPCFSKEMLSVAALLPILHSD